MAEKNQPDGGVQLPSNGEDAIGKMPDAIIPAKPNETGEQIAKAFIQATDGGKFEQEVAKSLVEGIDTGELDRDDLLSPVEISSRMATIQAKLKEIKNIEPGEREEFVLENRRLLIETRFYVDYARRNGLVEDKEGKEIWTVDDEDIDLGEFEREIDEAHATLASVTVETDEGEDKSVLEDLDYKRDTISPRDFKKLSLREKLALISNIKSVEDLGTDALLVFDFGTNTKLEYQVGLGDLMPPWVRGISLSGVEYKRRGNQGFYNNGKYLAIYNGTKVSITVSDEGYNIEEEYEKKFEADFANSELVAKAGGIDAQAESMEVSYKDLFEVSKDYLVDAFFLQAVTAELQFDESIATGGNYEFVTMAARYIQNAEAKYEELFGSPLHSSGKYYSEKFIAFAMDRFNLFNGYSPQSEDTIRRIMAKYGELRGVELKFDDTFRSERAKMNPEENKEYRRRSLEKGFVEGGYTYERPTGGKGIDMLESLSAWRNGLRESLRQKVPRPSDQQIEMTLFYSESVFRNMQSVMGNLYKSQVTLTSPEGENWTIKNSCVGATMSFSEGLPLAVMRGYQAGKRYACNKRWGSKKEQALWKGGFHYISSVVSSDDLVIAERGLNPGNCDQRVGQHLAVGEPAIAGFWNHALWMYKKPNGTVMMVHSGADVRARRIPASSVDEAPAGYTLRGNNYVRNAGSKVNEIPLREFLERKKKTYSGSRAFVKFVPMSTLVAENLDYATGAGRFTAYYEKSNDSRSV